MKSLTLIIFVLVLASCSTKGYWVNQRSYRAKKANFKLAKEAFIINNLIDTRFIYLEKDSLITSDGKVLKAALGFSDDGRGFLNSYNTELLTFQNSQFNSLTKAQQVGYYRTQGNNINFERFAPYDFGQYILWEGKIKGDTLEFTYRNFPNKERKYVFIKSNLPKE
jgi:hypothetical protein